jgi:hypothetical protein
MDSACFLPHEICFKSRSLFFKGIKNPCVLEEIVYPIYYLIFKEKLSSTIPSNLYLDFYNKNTNIDFNKSYWNWLSNIDEIGEIAVSKGYILLIEINTSSFIV